MRSIALVPHPQLELEALERKLLGDAVEQRFAALEMDEELEALKAQLQTKTDVMLDANGC